ncbi:MULTISPECIES: hypothetical protein [unclassified Streptomyces]|uniref:hypothetical protein n=1 Tax=unclassified Streptomyces TaxID=2593676 RepID=UPI0035D5D94E
MPHFLIRFTTDEPDRVIKAARLRPESRDGFDVYVAYSGSSGTDVVAYFTGRNVLSVEKTVLPRKADGAEGD